MDLNLVLRLLVCLDSGLLGSKFEEPFPEWDKLDLLAFDFLLDMIKI